MRELTDGELDSVGGGHRPGGGIMSPGAPSFAAGRDSWTGGGSSGCGLTGFLGITIINFINIGNTVGAQIGQQLNGAFSLNGIGV